MALKWIYRKGYTHGGLYCRSVCLTFEHRDRTLIEFVKLFPEKRWRRYSHDSDEATQNSHEATQKGIKIEL